MADTNTPNLSLLLPDLADVFNFSLHVENNFSTIDSLMGAVQCTSTTRPSNTYAGQIIYETDSKRYAQNTGTKASPVWTYMSHAALATTSATHPTSGLSVGLTIFETDTGLDATWNGSAFLYGVSQAAPTQTLGGVTASVTFSSLPAVNHLAVMWQARDNSGNLVDALLARFNADSGSHYGTQNIQGTSSTVTAGQVNVTAGTAITVGQVAGGGATAGYQGGGRIDIPGWSKGASGHQVTVVGVSIVAAGTGAGNELAGVYAGVYNPTTAVASLTLSPAAGSFVAGSVFSIYAMG